MAEVAALREGHAAALKHVDRLRSTVSNLKRQVLDRQVKISVADKERSKMLSQLKAGGSGAQALQDAVRSLEAKIVALGGKTGALEQEVCD